MADDSAGQRHGISAPPSNDVAKGAQQPAQASGSSGVKLVAFPRPIMEPVQKGENKPIERRAGKRSD